MMLTYFRKTELATRGTAVQFSKYLMSILLYFKITTLPLIFK